MPYALYKLIHFLGMFMVVVVLAATAMHVLRGGTRADNPYRRSFAIAHGIGAFLVLLGGFGMLARLGLVSGGLPGWIVVKLVIWLVLTAGLTLPYRGRSMARALLVILPLLAMSAGAVALYKPFTAAPAVGAPVPASP